MCVFLIPESIDFSGFQSCQTEPKPSPFFAINATTVEVTLSEAVTEIDKADFEIEGLDVTNAAIKQTNNKVVVLTTATQVGGTIYKLSYQGIDTGLTFTGISAVLLELSIIVQSKCARNFPSPYRIASPHRR